MCGRKDTNSQGLPDPSDQANERLFSDYLTAALGMTAELRHAYPLGGGYRNKPWRLTVSIDGAERSFVLRLSHPNLSLEYRTLDAIRGLGPRTPQVCGLDADGSSLGVPCFLMEFIDGRGLMEPLLEGASWAEDVWLDTICDLQAICARDLGGLASALGSCDALGFVEHTYRQFRTAGYSDPLVLAAYDRLKKTLPPRIEPCFGNGDLSPANMIVLEGRRACVIDFEYPSVCDPMFEFMSPIQWHRRLRHRGLEARFCERKGLDPTLIDWYRALVWFGTWFGTMEDPDSELEDCTAAQCKRDLEEWIRNT